jgi:hypothetical protein
MVLEPLRRRLLILLWRTMVAMEPTCNKFSTDRRPPTADVDGRCGGVDSPTTCRSCRRRNNAGMMACKVDAHYVFITS